MQPLESNAFADKHVSTEMIGATIQELCFQLVCAKKLSMGQV
jgi:hypothetical protein